MILLKDIKGQSNAVQYLQNSLSSGKIANGYLFTGPDGVGKATSVRGFLAELMCVSGRAGARACGVCSACKGVDSLNHFDVTWITTEKPKRIGIGEVRAAKAKLSLKPYGSQVNVCVIEDAHLMTPEAANALLKMLEEPPGKSLIVLISDKKEALLPTVVSRCVAVRFNPLSIAETIEIIKEHSDVDNDEARFLAGFSCGSPGRAIEMLSRGIPDRRSQITRLLFEISRGEYPGLFCWDKNDRVSLMEDFELLIMFFRDIAVMKDAPDLLVDKQLADNSRYDIFREYSIEKICDIIEKLAGIKRSLEGNVNPKLVAPVLPGIIGN